MSLHLFPSNQTSNLIPWEYFNFEFDCCKWTYFKKCYHKDIFQNEYDPNSIDDYWHFIPHNVLYFDDSLLYKGRIK